MALLDRLRRKPAPEPAVSEPPAEARGQRPELEQVLATRILQGHLSSRKQLMAVRPTDLRDLPAERARLLIRAMAAAAHADGRLDPLEHGRVTAALDTAEGLTLAEREELANVILDPPCLERLAREVADEDTATRFYAVSVAAISRGAGTNRAYLDYLAHRLRLPADVVTRLNRRFDVPV